MRQQSTSIMYIGQSWDSDDATKVVTSFSLLQDTGKPWRRNSTNKSQKMQHLGVRCFTLEFLLFVASLEVLVCSMDKRWQEQQIVFFFTMDWNWTYDERPFKRSVPLLLANFRPETPSFLLLISPLWSLNTLWDKLLRTAPWPRWQPLKSVLRDFM